MPSHGELRHEGEGREGTESSVSMFPCVCVCVEGRKCVGGGARMAVRGMCSLSQESRGARSRAKHIITQRAGEGESEADRTPGSSVSTGAATRDACGTERDRLSRHSLPCERKRVSGADWHLKSI